MKTLALGILAFVAGYGAASLGMRRAREDEAEPYRGQNVVPLTQEDIDDYYGGVVPPGRVVVTDTRNVAATVTVLPSWGTLYERDEA